MKINKIYMVVCEGVRPTRKAFRKLEDAKLYLDEIVKDLEDTYLGSIDEDEIIRHYSGDNCNFLVIDDATPNGLVFWEVYIKSIDVF